MVVVAELATIRGDRPPVASAVRSLGDFGYERLLWHTSPGQAATGLAQVRVAELATIRAERPPVASAARSLSDFGYERLLWHASPDRTAAGRSGFR